MRFLLDVHINITLARSVIAIGHDVLRAALDHGRWSDERLLDLAVTDSRIIVSQDSDFSELIYAFGKPVLPRFFTCDVNQSSSSK